MCSHRQGAQPLTQIRRLAGKQRLADGTGSLTWTESERVDRVGTVMIGISRETVRATQSGREKGTNRMRTLGTAMRAAVGVRTGEIRDHGVGVGHLKDAECTVCRGCAAGGLHHCVIEHV